LKVRANRIIWFLISIAMGTVVGLVYGWTINPVKYVNTGPASLRSDYKADYVLMVAEVYSQDQDVTKAASRLALLGEDPPLRAAQRAILVAENLKYNRQDIETLALLVQGLQGTAPTATESEP